MPVIIGLSGNMTVKVVRDAQLACADDAKMAQYTTSQRQAIFKTKFIGQRLVTGHARSYYFCYSLLVYVLRDMTIFRAPAMG